MIEITSPVGSFESLHAAIEAKTDSIYFGVGNLNMRSSAAVNFTNNDLQKIVRLCRENNIKAYLAINTVIFDHEIENVKNLIKEASKAGIDAIIATDIAVLEMASKEGIPVHMSTQANITNVEAVRFFSRWADVMVLSRELTLEKVRYIAEAIKNQNIKGPQGKLVRLEAFAHGALCMAVSGKCYMSLDMEGHSANRGDCRQICRRRYKLTDSDTGESIEVDRQYLMSPKDLATLPFLDQLIDAGVEILKIEGRGRPGEYVSKVTSIYKSAITAIEKGEFSQEKTGKWMKELSKVYNRGFWEGYYLGKPAGEWTNDEGSSSTEKKVFIGPISNFFSKLGVAEIHCQALEVEPGDKIMISGPNTGILELSVGEMHGDNGPITFAGKGIKFSIKVDKIVRKGDKVYKIISRT